MSVTHVREIVQVRVNYYKMLTQIDPDFQMSREELIEMLDYAIILMDDLHKTIDSISAKCEESVV